MHSNRSNFACVTYSKCCIKILLYYWETQENMKARHFYGMKWYSKEIASAKSKPTANSNGNSFVVLRFPRVSWTLLYLVSTLLNCQNQIKVFPVFWASQWEKKISYLNFKSIQIPESKYFHPLWRGNHFRSGNHLWWDPGDHFMSVCYGRSRNLFDFENMCNFKHSLIGHSLISPEQKSYLLKAHP